MPGKLSVIDLILHASFVVQCVMAILLMASVVSWAMIIQRNKALSEAIDETRKFEDRFWSGIDLSKLYNEVSARANVSGMESLFKAGFKEFARLHKTSARSPSAVMEGTQRAMRVGLSREVERLETHLAFLATVGSISPYHWFVWNRVGHHELIYCLRCCATSNTCHGGTGDCRSIDCYCDWSFCRNTCGNCLQQIFSPCRNP